MASGASYKNNPSARAKRRIMFDINSVKNEIDNVLPTATQIIEKGDPRPWIYEYGGIVPPTQKLSAKAKGIGVNVTSPEPDAVVRKMPIIISVNGKIYPSMILEN